MTCSHPNRTEGHGMTKRTERLWRAIVIDEDGNTISFLTYALDADNAMDIAEYQTGCDCVVVDDVTPGKRVAA